MGNRGYRAVQLEGGIRAGFAYLAAYASGVGATGHPIQHTVVRYTRTTSQQNISTGKL
jgi:hypothetical protein